MTCALTLLDDVRWNGEPVVGDRPGALLEALVEAGPAGRTPESLIDAVWGGDPPANPTKALQVLVSRVRSTTDARVIERTARGYPLGLGRDEVDVLAHADLVDAARARRRSAAAPEQRVGQHEQQHVRHDRHREQHHRVQLDPGRGRGTGRDKPEQADRRDAACGEAARHRDAHQHRVDAPPRGHRHAD